MNKQKQIEEMAKDLENTILGLGIHLCGKSAEKLYDLGYRKADEVRKETAEKIFAQIEKDLRECTIVNEGGYGWNYQGYEATDLRKRLTKLAKQFGVEVEE